MGKLTVDFSRDSEALTFTLSGRIDATNAYSFSDAVASVLGEGKDEVVVFDCGSLEYISSMGLRVLLSLAKRRSSPIKLVNVSHEVMSILNITGFSQIFDVAGGEE
ncbi:MAG: STAS domain-containing protein [Synergistaceae bacterium]|nr:STAS domain-containing protein [Synergistaceae bacterium]